MVAPKPDPEWDLAWCYHFLFRGSDSSTHARPQVGLAWCTLGARHSLQTQERSGPDPPLPIGGGGEGSVNIFPEA